MREEGRERELPGRGEAARRGEGGPDQRREIEPREVVERHCRKKMGKERGEGGSDGGRGSEGARERAREREGGGR